MDKIALFGGAFDPPHNGHLHVAKACMQRLKPDRLLWMPTAQSPHKGGARLATPEQRLTMCRLAAEGLSRVTVSDMEIRRGGKSYTVDTLRALKRACPDAHLYLFMGADMFYTLPAWHHYQDILSLATICPLAREQGARDGLREAAARLSANVWLEEITPLPLSSTEIRNRIRQGKPVDHLMPLAVEDYIRIQGLYR